MTFTTVHLMRHGEVDNPEGVLYGRLTGYGLTPLGKKMAAVAADYFVAEGADITHVIASPLLRAQQTATPTARAYDVPVEADPRLIEAGSAFEGVQINRNRWALAHPRNWRLYVRPLEPSWGEPYDEIVRRMNAAVSQALHEARGHEALLVSHQLPVVTVQRFVAGQALAHNPLNRVCSLASITSLTFDDNTLIDVAYTEPAAELLAAAQDMSPGASEAAVKR